MRVTSASSGILNCCVILVETDFESVLGLDLQQCLGVSAGVVYRMMCVFGFPEMLEVCEGVLDDALLERSQVHGAVSEGVFREEVMEIPVDELPVEPVVVGDEHRPTLAG